MPLWIYFVSSGDSLRQSILSELSSIISVWQLNRPAPTTEWLSEKSQEKIIVMLFLPVAARSNCSELQGEIFDLKGSDQVM